MKLRLYFSLIILGILIGCSHTQKEIPPPACFSSGTNSTAVYNHVEPAIYLSYANPKIIKTEAIEIEAPDEEPSDDQVSPLDKRARHNIDFEMNNRIQWWIKRYTGPERKYFRTTLACFDTVRPVMEKIFEKNGVPRDLTYLCMIESGGRANAVSRSGAAGYWQFTADTAKNYKLTVNSWVDERRDLVKSTNAAARYLKNLYSIFNDWLLAGAAYNAGEGNIYRIIKAHPEIDTFWDISYHMPIKHETLDYIPKLIATIVLAKNRAYYGLEESNDEKNSTLAYETVRVPNLTNLSDIADLLGMPNKQIVLMNPDLVKQCTPPGKGHDLKVPKGTAETVSRYVEDIKNRKKKEPAPDTGPDKKEKKEKEDIAAAPPTYTVQQGDTLYRIAKNSSVPVEALREANGLDEYQDITVGQELVIPKEDPTHTKKDKPSTTSKKRTHVVARGETLKGIAHKYGTTTEDIMEANGLEDDENIAVGKKLVIPEEAAVDKEKAVPPKALKKRTHIVAKGETLRGIARESGASVDDIMEANGLDDAEKLAIGQELVIPGEEPVKEKKKDEPSRASKKHTHIVTKGETLRGIARESGASVDDIMEANGLDDAEKLAIGQELVIPGEEPVKEKKKDEPSKASKKRTHVVARGETLKGIAGEYGSSIEDIIAANDLRSSKDIHPRMVLTIPEKSKGTPSHREIKYKVKKGDTLWSISRKFDVAQHDVMKWNRLKSDAHIHPGDEITIRRD